MITRKFLKIMLWIIPFFWGYYFSVVFRFTLDTLYPFYRPMVSLSIFFLLLLSIVWVSFFWHVFYHKKKRKTFSFYPLVLGLVSALFLFFVHYDNFEKIQYWYPFLLSLALGFYFFLLAYRLPYFIPFKLSFGGGIILGIIPNPILLLPSNLFLAGTMIGFLSLPYLRETVHYAPRGRNKMTPLRQNLDILRFFLLILSFYGILDSFRHYFFGLLALYSMGFLLQFILLQYHKKRFHIRFGIISLGGFFLVFGIVFIHLPIHFTLALMYVFLANWETLYFKKSVESYVEKEQLLFGVILAIGFLLYHIHYKWLFLPVSIFIVAIQFFILRYTYKKYRRALVYLFVVSLATWGYAAYSASSATATESFWISPLKSKLSDKIPDAEMAFLFPRNSEITTNLFPPEIIQKFNEKQNFYKIVKFSEQSAFLPPMKYLIMNFLERKENHFYLCRIPETSMYSSDKGNKYLFSFAREHAITNVYFYDPKGDRIFHPSFSSVKPVTFSIQKMNPDGIPALLILLHEMANWYEKNFDYNSSQHLYNRILDIVEHTKKMDISSENILSHTGLNEEKILKKMADLAGFNVKLKEQIMFLEKYIHYRKDTERSKITERRFLMELLFYDGRYADSRKEANFLITDDPQSAHSYFEWIIRIDLKEINPFIRNDQLHKLGYRVEQQYANPEKYMDQMRKKDLLDKIRDAIQSSETFTQDSLHEAAENYTDELLH